MATEGAPRPGHLHAVDLMRVLTLALVVGVHTVTTVPEKTDQLA